MRILQEILREVEHADDVYGFFASMHEAYGVLSEEVAELFEAVRIQTDDPKRSERVRVEAIQVAAVAYRMAMQADRVTR